MKTVTKERFLRLLFFTGLGGAYIASLACMVLSATLLEAPLPLLIALGFGTALLCGLIFYNLKTFLGAAGLLAVFIGVRFFILMDGPARSDWMENAGRTLRNVWGQVMGNPFNPEEGFILWSILFGLFGLLAVCAFYRRIHFWLAALPPLVCYLLGVMGRYETSVPASLTAFFCLVLLFLLSRRQKALGRVFVLSPRPGEKKGIWRQGALPVCTALTVAAAMGLAALVPFASTPAQTRMYVPQYADFGDFMQSFHLQGQWFSVTGFSDGDTRLGGDLYLDDSLVMEVQADERTYLSGAVYRTYDGRTWLDETTETVLTDPADMEAGWEEPLLQEGAYRTNRVTVTMRQTGDILFYPGNPGNLRLPSGSTLFTNEAGTYYLQPAMTPGNSYTAFSREIDTDAPAGLGALQLAGRNYYSIRDEWDSDGAAEAARIQQDYTQIPDEMPLRVQALAEDITNGVQGDYAMAKAIEEYLCANYTYSLQPGDLPEGADFVDYFLFEGREGYCTHFATAMVMLCRSVELPARFVKGFVTPAAPDDSGVYQVTGRMSHAWAEVYLAGLGWVRFEATPPFNPEWNQSPAQLDASVLEETEYLEEIGVYEPDEDGVGVSSIPENVVSPGSSSLPTVTSGNRMSAPPSSSDVSYAGEASNLLSGETGSLPSGGAIPSGGALPSGAYTEGQTGTPASSVLLGALLVGIFLLLLLVLLLVRILRVRRRIRRREAARGRERMRLTFREILRLLEYKGAEPRSGETAGAMARRLEADEAFAGMNIVEAAALYEAALFGGGQPSEKDCRRMDAIYDALLQKVRSGMSGLAFRWRRYIQNRL